jgi:hypothetical protein
MNFTPVNSICLDETRGVEGSERANYVLHLPFWRSRHPLASFGEGRPCLLYLLPSHL